MRHDLAQLLRQARARGWRVTPTRRGHWRLQYRTGALVFAAGSPSDPRSLKNLVADLRRAERRAAP
jgi:hypothetical protein